MSSELFDFLDRFFSNPWPSRPLSYFKKRHRIITKDGHIVITGHWKTVTINGKKIVNGEK